MSIGAKLGIATLSAGAIGGASYGGYVYFSKDSFASKLGISVLKLTGTDDQTVWGKRLEELKAVQSDLPTDLEALKASGKVWSDLQNWCLANSNKKFEKITDTKFGNFKKFCTWKIGDKLTRAISKDLNSDNEAWKTAHTSLKSKGQGKTLSARLKEVFDKVAGSNKEDQVAMHKWCTESYKNIWIGNNDKEFEEVQTYCQT